MKTRIRFENFNFISKCPFCDYNGVVKAKDRKVLSPKQIKIIRYTRRNVTVVDDEISATRSYYYTLTRAQRNRIILGDLKTIKNTPQLFLDAARTGRRIRLNPKLVFFAERPDASGESLPTVGTPLIFPVLKSLFVHQIRWKAQEVLLSEYLVPMRFLYPEAQATVNPHVDMNLKSWKADVINALSMWKKDPNHIAVMTSPVGDQYMGGSGKNLDQSREMRFDIENIVTSMGVPVSFHNGDAHFSGASVNMRALENEFQGNRANMRRLLDFVVNIAGSALGTEHMIPLFKNFRMADDMQRLHLITNWNQAEKLSTRTLLSQAGYDYDTEQKALAEERSANIRAQTDMAAAQAQSQAKGSIVQARYGVRSQEIQAKGQARIQQEVGGDGMDPQQAGPPQEGAPPEGPPQQPPQGGQGQQGMHGAYPGPPPEHPPGPGGDRPILMVAAEAVALDLSKRPDPTKALQELEASNPQLYAYVNAFMSGSGAYSPQAGSHLVDGGFATQPEETAMANNGRGMPPPQNERMPPRNG